MHMARAPWERMVTGRLFSRHPKLSCVCVCVAVLLVKKNRGGNAHKLNKREVQHE